MGDSSDPVGAEAHLLPSRAAPPTAASAAAPSAELGTLQHAIGNEAMGRLLRSPSGRDALGRAAGRRRGRALAPQLGAMDAPAEREIGPRDRPPAKAFFNAYAKVSYDVWKRGANPPGEDEGKQQKGPGAFIGG